jgi:osmoprotectant transport system permease protein
LDTVLEMFELYAKDWGKILELIGEHVYMSFTGVLIALLIGVPLAVLMTKSQTVALVIQSLINIIQTIPSLALLLTVMIFLGLGYTTVIVALICYSFLPIIQNTYVGLTTIDRGLLEAGRGMGMTAWQLLTMVKIPLALPIILAGIRVAIVVSVGITTIATLVGAGGLGELIYRGIVTSNDAKILAGSLPAALLAISLDALLSKLEKRISARMHCSSS